MIIFFMYVKSTHSVKMPVRTKAIGNENTDVQKRYLEIISLHIKLRTNVVFRVSEVIVLNI